jgi:hypothetical protein
MIDCDPLAKLNTERLDKGAGVWWEEGEGQFRIKRTENRFFGSENRRGDLRPVRKAVDSCWYPMRNGSGSARSAHAQPLVDG